MALSVGRRKSTVSTSGTSTPSLNTSTENNARSSPRISRWRFAMRSSIGVSASIAAEGSPASLNTRAMYAACFLETQNPSARMVLGSVTFSRTWRSTRLARMSLPVRTPSRPAGVYPPCVHSRVERSVPSATPK